LSWGSSKVSVGRSSGAAGPPASRSPSRPSPRSSFWLRAPSSSAASSEFSLTSSDTMADIAVHVDTLGKRYRIGASRIGGPTTLREAMSNVAVVPLKKLAAIAHDLRQHHALVARQF